MDLFTKIHNKRKRRSDDDSYENKRKNNLRSTREQMVYLTVFLLFVIVSIFVDLRGTAQNNEQFQLQENRWILETGEEIDVNNLPEGHHIVTSDLGKKTISGKSLCMKSIDTNFIVYADGEILYTYYPKIPLRFGVSYGMFVHSIAVPDNTRELKIEVDPIFSDTVAGLNEVVIGDSGQYMTELFRRNMVPFGLSSIILILGLIFLVTGLTSAILMRSAGIDFISFGTTCMMIGFVGFNDTMILQVLTGHPELIRVLTYVCLIFVPFPTLSFFASPLGKSRAWFVSGMLVVCLANFISQLLLTHYGITDYYHLVNISHAVIMLTLIASLWMIVDSIRKKTINSELLRSSIGGLVSCIIGVAIDMFRFHYLQSNGSSVFTSVGVLIFAVLMCTYMINKQKQALKQKNRDTVTLVGEIAEAFAKVVDMKDKYTNGHSLRVAQYTAMLAKELGYNDETVEKYYHIALLHDVGKIAIPPGCAE